MAAIEFIVQLNAQEHARLEALISEGAPGWLDAQIVQALDTNLTMVSRKREKLVTEGLDAVLTRKQPGLLRRSPQAACRRNTSA